MLLGERTLRENSQIFLFERGRKWHWKIRFWKSFKKQLLLCYSQRKYRMTTEPLLTGASNFVCPIHHATLSKIALHPDWRSDRKTQPGLQGFPALVLSSSTLPTHLIIRDLFTQLSWFIVVSLNGTNPGEKQHHSLEFCEKCQEHVRALIQAVIDVISLSDSWSNAHLSKITASCSCCLEDNLQCNALENVILLEVH